MYWDLGPRCHPSLLYVGAPVPTAHTLTRRGYLPGHGEGCSLELRCGSDPGPETPSGQGGQVAPSHPRFSVLRAK